MVHCLTVSCFRICTLRIDAYVDANSKGVFTGTKAVSLSAAATREEAALYVYNAITKIDKVYFDKAAGIYKVTDSVSPVTIAEATYNYR